MNNSPENPAHLLDLVRAKASSCADKAAHAGATGSEWERQAAEWRGFATELQTHGELAPLVPIAPKRRF